MPRTSAVVAFLFPGILWCWGDEGHQAVARIAAAHLTAAARAQVLRVLAQDPAFAPPSGAPDAAADAMARAAIWPDHMPGGKGATAPWHYVDIGLFESPANWQQRCPDGNCIIAKMKQYLVNLKDHRPDGKWTEAQEIAFLIHFAGDIHQPLHCATDADAGGNCVNVAGFDPIHNLHAVWDVTLVQQLMARDGGRIDAHFHGNPHGWQDYGSIENIAAESFAIAKDKVYGKARPRLPVIDHFIEVQPRLCSTEAPATLRAVTVDGPRSYRNGSLKVVRTQLYKGGLRLAAMLNGVY